MGTRCNILIGRNQFYHHWDGYPQGVGADLSYFLANVNAGYLSAWSNSLDDLARYIASNGIVGRLGQYNGQDRGYEAEPEGLHGDIEYLYIIAGTMGNFKLYCVDVWDYIQKNPSKSGDVFDHPFFGYTSRRLKTTFCRPEYEVQLPDPDCPEDARLYMSTGVFSHDEAKYCGMRKDLGFGDKEWETGIVRVRNLKSRFKGIMRTRGRGR